MKGFIALGIAAFWILLNCCVQPFSAYAPVSAQREPSSGRDVTDRVLSFPAVQWV